MKLKIYCLREFMYLLESLQSAYLLRHGTFITTNAATFPGMPHSGATVIASANALNLAYSLKDVGETEMADYKAQKEHSEIMMGDNYDKVDEIAGGDGLIVAKAGVKGSSVNTARTAAPGTPTGVKYVFLDNDGEVQFEYDADNLSKGAIIITTTDTSLVIKKSGASQILIQGATGKTLINISSTIKTVIQGLTKKDEITSYLGTFNPNGLSPLISPPSIIVPR